MTGLRTSCVALNTVEVNPAHGLYAFGGEDGRVEFWDPRSRTRSGVLDVGVDLVKANYDQNELPEISALRFHPNGLLTAIGTSSGHVVLYDLRHASPLLTKDHQYASPIKVIKFHEPSQKIISADSKAVRVWDKIDGKTYTSIEPEASINDMTVYPNSGLILVACEAPKIATYYIPSLGVAPRWCSFLDNLTEELEESKKTIIYDDYKFVTRRELSNLGLDHLIGTNLLRAYMHGFFVDSRLYEKAKSIANPFAYEEFKKKQVADKLALERQSRILLQTKLPRVNKGLAKKLLEDPANAMKRDRSTRAESTNPLGDARFSAIFTNPEYEINEESEEFLRLHPNEKYLVREKQQAVRELFEEEKTHLGTSDQQLDDEQDVPFDLNDLHEDSKVSRYNDSDSLSDDDEGEREREKMMKPTKKNDKKGKVPAAASKMYSLKTGASLQNVLQPQKNAAGDDSKQTLSLAERLQTLETHGNLDTQRAHIGAMSMSFTSNERKEGNRKKEAIFKNSDQKEIGKKASPFQQRRNVRELKFKKAAFRGRRR